MNKPSMGRLYIFAETWMVDFCCFGRLVGKLRQIRSVVGFHFWFQHDSLFESLWGGCQGRNLSTLVFQFSNPPSFSCHVQQETFDCPELNKNLLTKLALSYKSTYLPSPTPVKCTTSENEWYVASERLPVARPLMLYVDLVHGRVTTVSHDACHNIFDGVKYAQITTLTFEHPSRYHMSSWGLSKDRTVWFPWSCILAWLGLKV